MKTFLLVFAWVPAVLLFQGSGTLFLLSLSLLCAFVEIITALYRKGVADAGWHVAGLYFDDLGRAGGVSDMVVVDRSLLLFRSRGVQ